MMRYVEKITAQIQKALNVETYMVSLPITRP